MLNSFWPDPAQMVVKKLWREEMEKKKKEENENMEEERIRIILNIQTYFCINKSVDDHDSRRSDFDCYAPVIIVTMPSLPLPHP